MTGIDLQLHVIKGATRYSIGTSAGLIPANVVQTDEADDIVYSRSGLLD